MSQSTLKIGFIGGGNMAFAIVNGLIAAGHSPGKLSVADPSESQRARLHELNENLQLTEDNQEVANAAEVLVLAVKPQVMAEALSGLSVNGQAGPNLVVSIAAGVTLDGLGAALGKNWPIVRIMPNQPALVGAGMSVLVASPATSAEQKAQAEYIARSTGKALWIDDESLMDAVTAISGSGPAYFYLLMEIMADCAREMGLDPELAQSLVRQTALGAAEITKDSQHDLAQLRASVTSKGGTTHAAITSLEDAGIRDIFRRALEAARDRSMELGKTG